MKKDTINVLSVDWDYFINASANTRALCFPDGGNEDIIKSIQNAIWASLYATSEIRKKNIKKIEVNKNDCIHISEIICTNILSDSVFWVADSHKWAADVIDEIMAKNINSKINLVNVDFHHDVFDAKDTLKNQDVRINCGNWLAQTINKYDGNYQWVRKQDSYIDKNYKLMCSNYNFKNTEDISIIDNTYWDLVYICRSGMWTPPHLDNIFADTFNWIPNSGFACKIEKGIFTSRYTDEMKNDIAQLKEIQEQTIKAHKQ